MPKVSRQEFDAAAKRVMATAPKGLSRDDFYKAIDESLAGGDPSKWASGGTQYDTPEAAQKAKLESGEIPSSWIGGFLRSIKDDFLGSPRTESSNPKGYAGWGSSPSGTPAMKTPLEHSAQPESLGDFLSLLLPQGAGRAANLAKETELAGQGASAANKGKGVLSRVRGYWQGVTGDIQKPTQTLGSGDHGPIRYMENISTGPTRGVPSDIAPYESAIDRYMPNVGGDVGPGLETSRVPYASPSPSTMPAPKPPDPAPIFYKGQRIDPKDPLFQKLMEADIPENQLGPVDRPKVPTGFQDRGPVADQLRNEAFDRVANRQGMSQNTVGQTPASEPSPRMPQPESPSPSRPEPDPLARELMGPTSRVDVTSLKADAIKPEEWPGLRRYYGTKRLSELTGVPENIIEEMAPGPSRTPLEVEDRLNQNPLGVLKYLP